MIIASMLQSIEQLQLFNTIAIIFEYLQLINIIEIAIIN